MSNLDAGKQTVEIDFGPSMSILFGIFFFAKIFGLITWSWWWVTAPMWGPLALMLAIAVLIFVICIVGLVIEYLLERWRDQ